MSSKIIHVNSNNEKEVKNYGLGEELKVEINSMSIIPIIADKIYKDPMSSIRELYNNEVTACHKALLIDQSLKDKQEIIIELNTDTRELTIKGINSLGMDSGTFTDILRVMGNSGNSEADEKGLFGIGFYSFFKISERIIIISNSLESKENFAYICKSALKFERLKDENFEKLEKSGFKIIVNVKDEIDLRYIQSYIRNITKISGIKTKYIEDGENINLLQYENLMDYFQEYFKEWTNDPYNSNYSVYYEHYDNEDFELIIGKAKGSFVQGIDSNIQESFLLNTPIDVNTGLNYYNFYFLNLKNERLFKPTPDRERLEHDSEERLKNVLGNYDLKNFDEEKLTIPKSLDEYFNHPFKYFFDYIGENNNKIYIRTNVKSIHKTNHNGSHTFLSLKSHIPKIKPSKYYISKSFRKVKFQKLYDEENAFCICPRDKNKTYEDFVKMGFIDLSANEKSINRSNYEYSPRKTKKFMFHFDGFTREAIEKDVIVIRAIELNENKRALYNNIDYQYRDKVCFIPPMADHNSVNVKDLPNIFKEELYATNYGFLTFEQIEKIFKVHKLRYFNYYSGDCDLKTIIQERDNISLVIRLKNTLNSSLFRLYFSIMYNIHFSDRHYRTDFESLFNDLELDEYFKEFCKKKISFYNLDRDDLTQIIEINGRLCKNDN